MFSNSQYGNHYYHVGLGKKKPEDFPFQRIAKKESLVFFLQSKNRFTFYLSNYTQEGLDGVYWQLTNGRNFNWQL